MPAAAWYVGGKRGGPGTLSVKKREEMDSASCTMHGNLVFPGIDTTKAERWYLESVFENLVSKTQDVAKKNLRVKLGTEP